MKLTLLSNLDGIPVEANAKSIAIPNFSNPLARFTANCLRPFAYAGKLRCDDEIFWELKSGVNKTAFVESLYIQRLQLACPTVRFMELDQQSTRLYHCDNFFLEVKTSADGAKSDLWDVIKKHEIAEEN